jgi:DNA primase large subunit
LHADLAYEKAQVIAPGDKTAAERRALVQESGENIQALESFYKTGDFTDRENKLNEATAFPANETEAVKLSKQLIDENEYQLATIPAKTATEMDDGYRDAWLYLGIADLKTAQLVDLSKEAKATYIEKAKEALNKAKQIDPEYKVVSDYLNELNKG